MVLLGRIELAAQAANPRKTAVLGRPLLAL